MKTIISAILLFFSLAGFSQEVSPSTGFCFIVESYPSFTFNFHRLRKDCKAGFGICARYNWGDYRLVPCLNKQEQKEKISLEKDRVNYVIYLNESRAILHLPAELGQTPEFEKEDMTQFFIDDAGIILGDEKSGMAFRLKEGSYPVEEQQGHWVIAVDIEPVDIEMAR